jgi:hypothetical protein
MIIYMSAPRDQRIKGAVVAPTARSRAPSNTGPNLIRCSINRAIAS